MGIIWTCCRRLRWAIARHCASSLASQAGVLGLRPGLGHRSVAGGPTLLLSSLMRGWRVQGCMQICLSAKGLSSEPAIFLDSGCARLRGAFGFGGLLLKPADDSTPETGSTLTWYRPTLHAPLVLQCTAGTEPLG